MKRITVQPNHLLALLFAGMLATGTALAEKPEWTGGGKSDKQEQKNEGNKAQGKEGDGPRDKGGQRMMTHFGDQQRTLIHDYFDAQFRKGRCPPGLAKKQNGCMPPGQAKKWRMGQPLPRDVIFHDLPYRLRSQLGTPPAGHRYVRVASDILLITIGTGMVMDAIEDLGRM